MDEENVTYNPYSDKPTSIHVRPELTGRLSAVSGRSSGVGNDVSDQRQSTGSLLVSGSSKTTLPSDSAYASRRVTEISGSHEIVESTQVKSKDPTASEVLAPTVDSAPPTTESTNQMTDANRQTNGSVSSTTSPHLTPSHHPVWFANEEPKSKFRWSPRMGDQVYKCCLSNYLNMYSRTLTESMQRYRK